LTRAAALMIGLANRLQTKRVQDVADFPMVRFATGFLE
jgi:hypothetical protein